MTMLLDPVEQAKTNAALEALAFVEDGMTLGLGTGSTAEIFIELLGVRMSETDLSVRGVPTSVRTVEAAEAAGVPLCDIETVSCIDLAVDGADEVDPLFSLVKGGGGALLREKIIANAADHFLVVVHNDKMVKSLGAFPLPVEVDRFGFTITAKKVLEALVSAGCPTPHIDVRRGAGAAPFVTDGGHYILDCVIGRIPDPERAAAYLARVPGVVEHGLFIGQARTVIVGREERADVLER